MERLPVFAIGVLSTTSLLSVCVFVFLMWKKKKLLEDILKYFSANAFYVKIFLFFAAVGFFVCLYAGANTMLYWIPDDYGVGVYDGEDSLSLKNNISIIFSLSAGFYLIATTIDSIIKDSIED